MAKTGKPNILFVMLRLENIRASQRGAPSYDLYLNAPSEGDRGDHYVGTVSMFGVVESSVQNNRHSGSGVNAVFDITDVARRLAARGQWSPDAVRIAFRPNAYPSGELPAGDVSVGRIASISPDTRSTPLAVPIHHVRRALWKRPDVSPLAVAVLAWALMLSGAVTHVGHHLAHPQRTRCPPRSATRSSWPSR